MLIRYKGTFMRKIPTELNGGELELLLNNNKLTFIEFWASWCESSAILHSIISDVLSEIDKKIDFVRINIDKNKEPVSKYSVLGLPCFVIVSNNNIIGHKIGTPTKEELTDFILSSI
jgi:thioredoxin 1